MHHLGATRSCLKADHLLQTPDTFIRTPLPGAEGVEFVVHAAPQLGARFTQMTAEFTSGGTLGPAPTQRFLYVLEGELQLETHTGSHLLVDGGFAYLPEGTAHTGRAAAAARAAVIKKPSEPLVEAAMPELIIGNESSVMDIPLMGEA